MTATQPDQIKAIYRDECSCDCCGRDIINVVEFINGDRLGKVCASYRICGSKTKTERQMEELFKANMAKPDEARLEIVRRWVRKAIARQPEIHSANQHGHALRFDWNHFRAWWESAGLFEEEIQYLSAHP